MSAGRVVVAMSGGVDSSVAAALVAESGAEAIAVTMHLAGSRSRCCSLEDADDARRVAEGLGLRFYVANYAERFRSEVIEAFADSYLAGETPIPCVACNKRFKFDHLMERARVFGAERVATGHYARIEHDPRSDRWKLLRARDGAKDQTYFLFQLDQTQLERAWFPVGELTKAEVRERARALGLVTADKPESQEICFVPDGSYADVVEAVRPGAAARVGDFVDGAGKVLGQHRGVHRYTVGQRRGLGLSDGRALYVTRIDPLTRRVQVGDRSELEASSGAVREVSWVAGEPPTDRDGVTVQIRYRHEGAPVSFDVLEGGRLRLQFPEPVVAVSPGQAAVFYRGEEVLGGGWLTREAA